MDDAPDKPSGRARPLAAGLAWATAGALLAAIIATGVAASALRDRSAPHQVLDARLTSLTYFSRAGYQQISIELWIDPTLSRARLRVQDARADLFYLCVHGNWYSVGRYGSGMRWQRTRVKASQAPSLATLAAIRSDAARLRAASNQVVPVDLHRHLAYAVATASLRWPYRYEGPATVWLDGHTGLPRQYRIELGSGNSRTVVITRVDSMRTIRSTTLPADFFAPPDRPATAWESLVRSLWRWL